MALFEEIGGTPGCRRLSEAFYRRVAHDPVLRPFFPGKSFRCAIEAFSSFLVQFLGGPDKDTQDRYALSLRGSHARFRFGARERAAWLRLMREALDEVPMAQTAHEEMHAFFLHASAFLIRAEGPENGLREESGRRWQTQLAIEEAVAAIGSGDVDRAIALADRSWGAARFAKLLAIMMQAGHPKLVRFVRGRIEADPELARARFEGWTLLHAAAASGCLEVVDALLALGVDPNLQDGGGHTPLYRVANGCQLGVGADVARSLIRAGASVDAADGVKHCTPLHMAARRGAVEVAQALLESGAALEARDTAGDTPLRRAVNCGKVELARLLLQRGANPESVGSKRLTVRQAARTAEMKRLLHP